MWMYKSSHRCFDMESVITFKSYVKVIQAVNVFEIANCHVQTASRGGDACDNRHRINSPMMCLRFLTAFEYIVFICNFANAFPAFSYFLALIIR